MSSFVMPSLGADMTAAKLVEQTIAAGTAFRRGDVIAAVETQKGVIEVEVFEDGILDRWLVELGTTVPVGAPLAEIRQMGEQDVALKKAVHDKPPPAALPTSDQIAQPKVPAVPRSSAARPRITPSARRLAAQRGFDLTGLSAIDRIVTRQEIVSLTEKASADDAQVGGATTFDMRSAIAAAMTRSKQEIPHYYLAHQTDLSRADAFLRQYNATRSPEDRLLLGALYAKAIALALAKYPEFNGQYGPDGFRPAESVHVGVAIHIRSGGLVAPAIFDADTRSVDELMRSLRDLVARVRAGRFRARELSDATITLTSLGERGVDQVIGVIYPPQVAIVGIGTPRLQPMVNGDSVVPRLSATLTLAADHRVSDGHRGALFLRAIDAKLQEPELL